jgi:hypothetical protein
MGKCEESWILKKNKIKDNLLVQPGEDVTPVLDE